MQSHRPLAVKLNVEDNFRYNSYYGLNKFAQNSKWKVHLPLKFNWKLTKTSANHFFDKEVPRESNIISLINIFFINRTEIFSINYSLTEFDIFLLFRINFE